MSCELFEFTIGTETLRFTNNPSAISYGGNSYTPAPIVREDISNSADNIETQIMMPLDQIDTLETFIVRMYSNVIWVKIMTYFSSSSVPVIFLGLISHYAFTGKKQLKMRLTTFKDSNNCLVPQCVYQPSCRWELFSPECGLSKSATGFRFQLVYGFDLTNVGNKFTLPHSVGGIPDTENFFLYGTIEIWGDVTETLFVTKQVVNVSTIDLYTLTAPYTTTTSTLPAYIYMGCDKKLATCYAAPKGNIDNFGGFPFVPTKNIFKDTVI